MTDEESISTDTKIPFKLPVTSKEWAWEQASKKVDFFLKYILTWEEYHKATFHQLWTQAAIIF